jgi:threonine aldolase
MATKLAAGLASIAAGTGEGGIRVLQSVEANEVFLSLPERVLNGVFRDGHTCLDIGAMSGQKGPGELLRCVCSWDTKEVELDAFLQSIRTNALAEPTGEAPLRAQVSSAEAITGRVSDQTTALFVSDGDVCG